MGRFATLNADTQDLVNCLLPVLAADFKVKTALEIIPVDIRMRAWDCERRDHIKDETENDPRNWGVQFLKDLKSITRLNGGNLEEFQARLRAKVDKHEANHPWCRLSDVKELKAEYEHPDRPKPPSDCESYVSSIDSYLEELHEPDLPKGVKRDRKRNHEIYETRLQLPRKQGRLRRAEDGTVYRKVKNTDKRRKIRESTERSTPDIYARRPNRTVASDEDEVDNAYFGDMRTRPRSSFSATPRAFSRSDIADAVNTSNEPLEVQKLQAELELAEAELRAARLKYQYIQAREAAGRGGAPKLG
ncbi:uncharacterized protein EKO05_0008171 [Ascochyta rabiei]|uniref:Uncharacterized protein n=1 Tax=Didymella rabiei TaxID=5454 RepID=A0A163DB29_DIDRA|nr:uncharacterized protein EKO05_0008171 [Ascochyta rabiei]KZM23041.1 hypothetical protein ST47_g5855 [Ascochyta rabiei]UPX17843.1 hypothetical protein EKO05_0008171 [Ascochyta rabiei]